MNIELQEDGRVSLPLDVYQALVKNYDDFILSVTAFKAFMKKEGLNITLVSEITGLSRPLLSRMCTQQTKPTNGTLDTLRQHFDTSTFIFPVKDFSSPTEAECPFNRTLLMSLVRDESIEFQRNFRKEFHIPINGCYRTIAADCSTGRFSRMVKQLEIDYDVILIKPLPKEFLKEDLEFKQKYKGANLFHDYLKFKKCTSTALSEKAKIRLGSVTAWRNGKFTPRLRSYLRIIHFFSLPFDYFL